MENNQELMGMTDSDRLMMTQQELGDQHAREMLENPFDNQQYVEANGSDEPIQHSNGMADILLNDDTVPLPIKHKWWWVFANDNTLTFLDDQTKNSKLMSFDIAILDALSSMDSYYDYTFKDEAQFGIIRNAFETKLDRAKGTTAAVKNERSMMQSQFTESKNINEVGNIGGTIKEGFFKRLLGRR